MAKKLNSHTKSWGEKAGRIDMHQEVRWEISVPIFQNTVILKRNSCWIKKPRHQTDEVSRK